MPIRVLIVDDEAIIRGMLQIELADRYEVFTAESGQAALELAAWLAEYVDANYRPEPKKRARPPSFKGARRDA